MFPEWSLNLIHNVNEFPHATELRYQIFHLSDKYLDFVHPSVGEYIKKWSQTEVFQPLMVLHNLC
jgi:hypothetical protein